MGFDPHNHKGEHRFACKLQLFLETKALLTNLYLLDVGQIARSVFNQGFQIANSDNQEIEIPSS
jgi:hypothetical protein